MSKSDDFGQILKINVKIDNADTSRENADQT